MHHRFIQKSNVCPLLVFGHAVSGKESSLHIVDVYYLLLKGLAPQGWSSECDSAVHALGMCIPEVMLPSPVSVHMISFTS